MQNTELMITKEQEASYKHAYYLANKVKWKESYRRQYDAHPERFAARCAKWRAKNRKRLCERQKRYAAANKELVLARARAYQKRTLAARREQKRGYRVRNRERIRKYFRAYMKQRSETDANFKLRSVLRSRIFTALRRKGLRKTKSDSTLKLVGCDIQFLRGYLEARFISGMSWENIGRWHIDHHIPLAEFDLRDLTQQKQAFHYSNLKPMWGVDNIRKGKKRPATHQAEMI